jgi:hypothetical protein
MAFTELLKDPVLLAKAVCVPCFRVSENKSSFVNDCDLITILEFAVLISAKDGFVYKTSIAGQIFQNCHHIAVPRFIEYQAVTI